VSEIELAKKKASVKKGGRTIKKKASKPLSNKERYEKLIKEKKIGPLHEYKRSTLYSYLNDPSLSRKDQTARKSKVAKLLGKEISGVKNMSLYASGSSYEWDLVCDYLSSEGKYVNQKEILDMIISYNIIKGKVDKVPKPLKNILKGLTRLDEKQLSLIEVIINHTNKLNDSDS
jgi:hypothetical protein